eukprot:scaffold419956_cov17-Prasinocladus_malaysianus.AAC.1
MHGLAGILARLAPHLVRTQGEMRFKAQALDERMWELCRRFLNQDADTSNPESDLHNPAVAAIASAKRQVGASKSNTTRQTNRTSNSTEVQL